MRYIDLFRLMQREPCPRLRLHLTGGLTFEISDPDEVVLDRSTVELLLPSEQGLDREAVINLLHIVWIEVLSPTA
jgi:hypothetical protein